MTMTRLAIRAAAFLALCATPAHAADPAEAAPVAPVAEVSAPPSPTRARTEGPLRLVSAALGLPVPDKPAAPEPAAAPAAVPPPAPVPAPTAPVKIHKEEPVPEDVAEEGDNGPEAADRSPPGTPVVLLEEVERAQKRAQKGQSVPPQETIITALPVSVSSEPAPDPRAVTDPPLNLTMDRSEVLRIPRPASSVLVGNPAHIGVLVDDARTLIVVPRAPGATFLTVLDAAKNIVVQRHVIVAAPGKPYIRVRKTCAGGAEGCEPVKAYYCPGMCHEIEITEAQGGSAGAAPEESQMDTVVLPPELMGGPR